MAPFVFLLDRILRSFALECGRIDFLLVFQALVILLVDNPLVFSKVLFLPLADTTSILTLPNLAQRLDIFVVLRAWGNPDVDHFKIGVIWLYSLCLVRWQQSPIKKGPCCWTQHLLRKTKWYDNWYTSRESFTLPLLSQAMEHIVLWSSNIAVHSGHSGEMFNTKLYKYFL